MQVNYAVYHKWNKEQVKILATFGIHVTLGMDRFDIEESTRYFEIEKLLNIWGVQKSVSTFYNKKDIADSKYLVLIGVWENGYPQPESVNEYMDLTYNLDNYCKDCGIGAVQKQPFRLKKEPKWGDKKIFELIWVMDEIFVRKDIYDEIFKGLGIDYRPVLLYKKDTISENTVQLSIPLSDSPLLIENQPFETCINCGQKKFSPKIHGYFPGFKMPISESSHILKSVEYFGSSSSADRRILISQALLKKFTDYKIKPRLWAVR